MPSVAFERVLLYHRPHRAYGHLLNTEFGQRLVGCAGDVAKPSRLLGSTPCSGPQMPVRIFTTAPPFTAYLHPTGRDTADSASLHRQKLAFPGMMSQFISLCFRFFLSSDFRGDWRLMRRPALPCRFLLSVVSGLPFASNTSVHRMGSSISCSPVGTNGKRRFILTVKNLHTLRGSILCRSA